MDDYVGLVKHYNSNIPYKVYVSAKNLAEALDKMCDACKVSSPSALAEFELLKVIDGGDGYLPVAGSPPRKGRTLPVTFPPNPPASMALVPIEKIEPPPIAVTEATDVGYTLAEA